MTMESTWSTADDVFYAAVLAHHAGDWPSAATLAARAAALAPDRAVYREAARYLERGEVRDVYDSPAAFTAFARGGGNVALYRSVHETLRAAYARLRPQRLLDLGTGEGHGLLPALGADVGHVTAVEPSHERLAIVTAELTLRDIPHQAHAISAQQLVARDDSAAWDLVQETFALLAVSPSDRAALFRWLRPRTRHLIFVEFDVADLGTGFERRRFQDLVSRYEQGIREYDRDRELVAQGFLIPVLLSALGGTGATHHEQPIARWVADLTAAGFTCAEPARLCDYWWAPAYALVAT